MTKRSAAARRRAGSPTAAGRARGGGPAGAAGRPLAAGLVPAIAAALALLAHARCVGAFFTTDDLILFERARGIVPWPWTAWRLVSGRLWWQALLPLFGVQPAPWHVANLALHALDAALVAMLATRLGLAPAFAALAGGAFGLAASAMPVTWSATGAGELLAAAFALAGLLALLARPPRAWTATGLFAIGLLCKESIALVPLAVLPAAAPGARRALAKAAAPALALGVVAWLALLLGRDHTGSLGGESYAFGLGPHVLGNLVTYAAWSADRFALAASPVAVTPALRVAGIALLLAPLLLAVRGSRAAGAGLSLWLLALLPVLPLTHHTYVHYLYLPFAGWCVANAALAEAATAALVRRMARPRAGALPGLASAALLALLGAGGQLAMSRTLHERSAQLGLASDSFVRRMEIARDACTTLAGQVSADVGALVVLRPAEAARLYRVSDVREQHAVPARMPTYDLLVATLDDGRGVRALLPELTDVRFRDTLEAADSSATLAAADGAGNVRICGRGLEGAAAVARLWMRAGYPGSAKDLAASALALWPARTAPRAGVPGFVPPRP